MSEKLRDTLKKAVDAHAKVLDPFGEDKKENESDRPDSADDERAN